MTDIPPDDFLCPITRMIMDDPVYSLHTGLSYEKAAIEKWLSREGKNYCPVTGKPLAVSALKPNESLSWKIKYWKMKHGVEDTETSVDEIEEDVKLLPEARFVCPLTGKVMVDPVMTRHGNNFERSAIMKWIHMRGEVCPITGEALTQPYVVSNSRLAWEIKQWLLSVSEYADDIEYDPENNVVHATAHGHKSAAHLSRDKNADVVLSASMKDLGFKDADGGGGDGKKHAKKSSRKQKDRVHGATGAGGILASPVPKHPSRSRNNTVAAHGAPQSAPADGVKAKARFKLRSPQIFRNMLSGVRGNGSSSNLAPPTIDLLADDDDKKAKADDPAADDKTETKAPEKEEQPDAGGIEKPMEEGETNAQFLA